MEEKGEKKWKVEKVKETQGKKVYVRIYNNPKRPSDYGTLLWKARDGSPKEYRQPTSLESLCSV